MNDTYGFIGSAVVIVALLFFMPLVGVIFGAFAGWVVGFYWTSTILQFLQRFGVDTVGLEIWEIGAAIGFLGSFFKSSPSTSSSK